ncbi:hypothetical protein [Avibacterium paragallinarum]|uniref:Uncharacterized protein n=2 Tax=Avibacterium paragallinarum TaxID=728 RepID=A0AAE5TIZ1_AVIPA|nr:hypothetical protein [Avibacterium paragallinarum]MEE3607475.1 hypothetical protein [Avibacterium paragallinarum]MEE3622300.1 hypothetical protein [Avibacterium paragallinarum]MEE3682035.1 hypothetical protein [Avibacterium paragallinarum]MEE4386772.1 hypothetical protein [Avibacterium paragallinarum]PXZ39862.1 hypothetical protein DM482_03775 [Avibacterium paragallinarum]
MKKIRFLFFLIFSLILLYSIFTGHFLKPSKDFQNGQKIVLSLKKKYNLTILYNLKFYTIDIKISGKINDDDLIALGFRKKEKHYCSDYGNIHIKDFSNYQILMYKNIPC